MKRPTINDPAIVEAAARRLAPMTTRWLLSEFNDEIIEDLKWAYERSFSLDGYDMAQELSHRGWAPDAELVEIMSSAAHYLFRAKAEAVRNWVVANKIEPDLAVGDYVHYDGQIGEIIEIDRLEATYTVFFGALGHVKEGHGTKGLILAFESVSKAEPSPNGYV